MYSTTQKWKENIYKNVQCAMNIYIDDVLINPDYILDFKKGGNVFEEELYLGSTPSQYIELQIYKEQAINPKVIRVEYGILINYALTVAEVNAMLVGTLNGIPVKSLSENDSSFEMIPIGTYNVDDYTDNDDGTLTIKALDNMIKFEFNYDGSELVNEKAYATLLEVAQDICNKAGVELGSTSFLNSEKQIAVYDNTVTAREYISYIAESAGCFAVIGRNGKLYFKHICADETEIPLDMFGEYKWGEEFKISKVSYEDGVRSFKFGDETRNNLWISQDNMYIVDEEQVENIYNKIKGLVANSFEGKTIIDPAIDIGDKIIINGKPVIYQGEMILEGRFVAQISSKIQIKQKEDTTIKKESQKVVNRRIQSRIDEVEGKITQLVEDTSENSQKLTKHEQSIEGITDTVSTVEENLADNYYNKTETDTKFEQTDSSIGLLAEEIDTITGDNNIKNGEFNNDLDNWGSNAYNGSVTIQKYNNKNYANLRTRSDSAQLSQVITGMFSDMTYNLSFDAFDNGDYFFVESDATFVVKIHQIKSGSEEVIVVKEEQFVVTETEQNFNLDFTLDEDNGQVIVYFDLKTNRYLAGEVSLMLTNIVLSGGNVTEKLAKLNVSIDGINTEVSKKVGNDEIISKINQSSESVSIDANRVSLNRKNN